MLLELLFNALLDRLMPLEFDGTAHVRVSLADPRLQPLRLLRWEMANAQRLAASVLPPAQHMLARADVRDKLARLAQCALRALGAAFELPACGPAADEILRSRRCFRWVEGVTQLLVLYEQPSSWDEPRFATALGVGSRLGRLGFVWLENTRWLQQHGFLHGSNESTARRAVRCLAAGYACSLLLAVSRAARCGETRGDSERASRPQREACRHLLLLLQASLASGTCARQDAFVGVLGVLTSLLDLQELWRTHGPSHGVETHDS
ncbi:hypothetical protein AB1Y20_011347 [Prymnesium parvum]|uniref:Peroxisomal membrane protein PEX16 n=1 Tax=Prymnesium parvum TaxID=97485 RepID=A0AB34IMY6_PRYPA